MCAGRDAWVSHQEGVSAVMVSLLGLSGVLGNRTKTEIPGETGGFQCLRDNKTGRSFPIMSWEISQMNKYTNESRNVHSFLLLETLLWLLEPVPAFYMKKASRLQHILENIEKAAEQCESTRSQAVEKDSRLHRFLRQHSLSTSEKWNEEVRPEVVVQKENSEATEQWANVFSTVDVRAGEVVKPLLLHAAVRLCCSASLQLRATHQPKLCFKIWTVTDLYPPSHTATACLHTEHRNVLRLSSQLPGGLNFPAGCILLS